MKLSIQLAVILIIGLLFLASLISLYFALGNEQTTPLTLVASANIVAVILLTFLITRGIMQPLRYIREIMKQVGAGDLDKHIDLKATREMEEVGEAFNDMIFKLHNARKEIEDANKILERRVKERTRQLETLASSLEGKVQGRTKELQEKIEQLERFQKLAVGRELRMVELKDEIRALEQQLLKRKPLTNAPTAKARKPKSA